MSPIELHQFVSNWTLPNPSPFCLKVETWLRMAGLPYEIHPWNPKAAPMGKAPFVRFEGRTIADSSVIVRELTAACGVSLDRDVGPHERAKALLIQRTLEEHTYWVMVYTRWIDEAGWATYKPVIAASMPGPMPGVIAGVARRGVLKAAHAQGLSRHEPAEVYRRGIEDLDAIGAFLGERPFLLGDAPTSVDTTGYGFLAQILHPGVSNPFTEHARSMETLVAYVDRMRERYWAEPA